MPSESGIKTVETVAFARVYGRVVLQQLQVPLLTVEPQSLGLEMEALLAAWNCANTEHGDGTKKPVPNADGWSINWKGRRRVRSQTKRQSCPPSSASETV